MGNKLLMPFSRCTITVRIKVKLKSKPNIFYPIKRLVFWMDHRLGGRHKYIKFKINYKSSISKKNDSEQNSFNLNNDVN